MLPVALRNELHAAVATSALLADKDIPAIELARRIISSEANLMQRVQERLLFDFLVREINKTRDQKQSWHSQMQQLRLPGFEFLPYRITVNKVQTVLSEATFAILTEYYSIVLKSQRRKRNAKLESLQKLINIVSLYDSKVPGITVSAVLAAEKLKRGQEPQ